MRLRRLLLNKYSISALILLLLAGTDVMLHKGMTRVMLPYGFTEFPVSQVKTCSHSINATHKEWLKGVNTIRQVRDMESSSGIETDVYFDSVKMEFFVYHDSSKISTLTLDSLLAHNDKISAAWLDVKNLNESNSAKALAKLNQVQDEVSMLLLVESPDAKALKIFCDNGYATILYSPFFNPYTDSTEWIRQVTASMQEDLGKYPAAAVSGYYFQYPYLKHVFPDYPVVTWSVKHSGSAISYMLNRQLMNDTSVKIVLYPAD